MLLSNFSLCFAGTIVENLDFTEDEIQEQLVLLGYRNIPKQRLSSFKKGGVAFYADLLVAFSLQP